MWSVRAFLPLPVICRATNGRANIRPSDAEAVTESYRMSIRHSAISCGRQRPPLVSACDRTTSCALQHASISQCGSILDGPMARKLSRLSWRMRGENTLGVHRSCPLFFFLYPSPPPLSSICLCQSIVVFVRRVSTTFFQSWIF